MSSPLPSLSLALETAPYARCVEMSRQLHWDLDHDLLCGRSVDFSARFLPASLSRVDRLAFLDDDERLRLDQIEGRTYAALFGWLEGLVAEILQDAADDHPSADEAAVEALVRHADEALVHQAMFVKLAQAIDEGLPPGRREAVDRDEAAASALAAPPWTRWALVYFIETTTQAHLRKSLQPGPALGALWRDVPRFHARASAHHLALAELEWRRVDAHDAQVAASFLVDAAADADVSREYALTELERVLVEFDDGLRAQALADVDHWARLLPRALPPHEERMLREGVQGAYRDTFIASALTDARFNEVLASLAAPGPLWRMLRAFG